MKITVNYGTDALVVPGSIILKLDKATKRDIKILFTLLSSPDYRSDTENKLQLIARECGCSESDVTSCIAFWRGVGIIDTDEASETSIVASEQETQATAAVAEAEVKVVKKPSRSQKKLELPDEFPHYTTSELSSILEKNPNGAMLIDECQRLFGKMFNTHEANIVLALQDYLGLDLDYILVLFDHCAAIEKRSLHYVKKLAFSLYNDGITDAAELQEHLLKIREVSSVEGEIRKLFGMKSRELTTKEKKHITNWICKFGYGIDVIKKAYELTVDTIHEPSPSYANAIIERWHTEGLKTLADIEASMSEKLPSEGSFDTDEFFEAALNRSFNN